MVAAPAAATEALSLRAEAILSGRWWAGDVYGIWGGCRSGYGLRHQSPGYRRRHCVALGAFRGLVEAAVSTTRRTADHAFRQVMATIWWNDEGFIDDADG